MTDERGAPGRMSLAATQPAAGSGASTARETARESTLDMASLPLPLPQPGYQMGGLIGRGGMGEVVTAFDRRIGREVAIKRMRDAKDDAGAVARFMREARIQARLDHFAIVPVHEIGTDDQGRPFFTMKKLAGVTLAERIADGTARNRLLGAFVDVCNAIDLAHARGVVHRDLKPANIMLGHYGEVYVLDWGVARILDDREDPIVAEEPDSLDGQTQTGALLGTPGYMPPEQVQGKEVGPAADVYGLGAILFEILTREPLHPRGGEALAHTLSEPQGSPASRAPEAGIGPELDRLCWEALAADPAARPTTRELADRVQSYLDGDRDLEQRRMLARTQLVAANAAAGSGDRAGAMRHAGRALALEPESRDAAALVTKLMVEPPEQLPAELVQRLERIEVREGRSRIKRAALAYASPLILLLGLPWMHVRSWPWLIGFYVALVIAGGVALWMGRVLGRTNAPFLLVSNMLMAVLWSRLAGPLILTPVMVCGVLIAFASQPDLRGRPLRLLSWGLVVVVLPFVLEYAGILPRSLAVIDGTLSITPTAFVVGTGELVMFIVANTLFVLVVGSYAAHLGGVASAAQYKLHIQAWHLAQLLPASSQQTLASGPVPLAPRPT
ncbi:MAG TPA: serine/threonine-protein kinase [Kofleriaceae bacterium]|nr:serine/threonine-protein kinase [Kofleriaceae bacterium]